MSDPNLNLPSLATVRNEVPACFASYPRARSSPWVTDSDGEPKIRRGQDEVVMYGLDARAVAHPACSAAWSHLRAKGSSEPSDQCRSALPGMPFEFAGARSTAVTGSSVLADASSARLRAFRGTKCFSSFAKLRDVQKRRLSLSRRFVMKRRAICAPSAPNGFFVVGVCQVSL